MKWKIKLFISLFACMLPISAHASPENEYIEFFKKYESLANEYNILVADMYSDEATIHVFTKLPDGTETTTKLNGKKIKKIINTQFELAKKIGGRSEYSKISIAIGGKTAKINASRYSTLKCFQDENYHMVIEKNMDDKFQIIEEFFEDPIQTSCKKMDKEQLGLLLQSLAMSTNGNFPLMIDTETRAEKTSAEGEKFRYHYTLIHFASNEINHEVYQETMSPIVTKHTCAQSILRPFMDMGAIFEHVYNGKDNKGIATISVTKSDCEKQEISN